MRVACLWRMEMTILIPVSDGLSKFFYQRLIVSENSLEMCGEHFCLALVCKLE